MSKMVVFKKKKHKYIMDSKDQEKDPKINEVLQKNQEKIPKSRKILFEEFPLEKNDNYKYKNKYKYEEENKENIPPNFILDQKEEKKKKRKKKKSKKNV
ncbi:hypothetical protein M0811_06099 [Anaeramoeba ignava]|uniref:Uncharacterized protein n=1 Tax=Anaeramoeba ignava TaxID=1746090 RepID=A0A9Q0LQ54_ANAIG|nr:hypothetical protein M0811_06099 [Anaeramoeba ignava]